MGIFRQITLWIGFIIELNTGGYYNGIYFNGSSNEIFNEQYGNLL